MPTKPTSGANAKRVSRFKARMASVYRTQGDEAQEALLALLCDTYARYLAMQAVLRDEGEVIPGWHGDKRRHPGVLILRDCRIAMTQLFGQLEAGRDRSKNRRVEADDAIEAALTSGPRLVNL